MLPQVGMVHGKFPERYRFQLTINDIASISRSEKSATIMQTTGSRGGRIYLSFAFTEQGIYMLMTVLKGDAFKWTMK